MLLESRRAGLEPAGLGHCQVASRREIYEKPDLLTLTKKEAGSLRGPLPG